LRDALHILHGHRGQPVEIILEPAYVRHDLAEAQPIPLVGDAFGGIGELGARLLDRFTQFGLAHRCVHRPLDLGQHGLLDLVQGVTLAHSGLETEGERVHR